MTSTTNISAEAATYLAELGAELADLEATEREELLEDVLSSLTESESDGGQPLETRLGTPAEFAAELRTAAGLRPQPLDKTSQPGLWSVLRGHAREVLDTRWVRAASANARILAPLWWLARVYVLCVAVALAFDQTFSVRYPFIPLLPDAGGTALWGGFLALVSVGAGLHAHGQRPARWAAGTLIVMNLALLLAVIPVIDHLASLDQFGGGKVRYVTVTKPRVVSPTLLERGGHPVRNIFAYTRGGRRLQDVRLFDEAGRPLSVGTRVPTRRLLATKSGRAIFNSFPIRYRVHEGRSALRDGNPLAPRLSPVTPLGTPSERAVAATESPGRGNFRTFCLANPGACPAPTSPTKP